LLKNKKRQTMVKNGMAFGAAWFISSTAVGLLVGRRLLRATAYSRFARQRTTTDSILVIPAHGPSYIYSTTDRYPEQGLLRLHNN
jgi:hypothetical protein